MLVLSRKTGEKIYIGEDVFVEVRKVAGNRVTLAVSAPKSIRILRGELKDADDSFEVLAEAEVPESAIDTVIIKHDDNHEVAKPHTLAQTEANTISHAK